MGKGNGKAGKPLVNRFAFGKEAFEPECKTFL
jgi:hypothetical protein